MKTVVGQVTPELLNKIGYGTYILFGLLTFLGAGFIWFFVSVALLFSIHNLRGQKTDLLTTTGPGN